jgi:hypothetical protein
MMGISGDDGPLGYTKPLLLSTSLAWPYLQNHVVVTPPLEVLLSTRLPTTLHLYTLRKREPFEELVLVPCKTLSTEGSTWNPKEFYLKPKRVQHGTKNCSKMGTAK